MRILVVTLLALLTALPVAATPVWTAPGWYQVADTIVGPFVWKGPFADKPSCEQTLPANEDDADYACEYLDAKPSWDE